MGRGTHIGQSVLVAFASFLIFLPATLGVLYVRAYGVSVVKRDAWSMVPLFDRWSSGTLQLSDFFVQHFEHKSTFPEIAMLLLGIATKYNNVAEMYLIQICLLATVVILLLAFSTHSNSPLGLFLFVPISILIFGLRQYANMLFGYQINFAFVQTFGVLTLFLLYVAGHRKFKKIAFIAALGSATVATYSVVQGLLVWPAGLMQLAIASLGSRSGSRKQHQESVLSRTNSEQNRNPIWDFRTATHSEKNHLTSLEKPLLLRLFIVLWSLIGLAEWVAYLKDWSPRRDCSSFIDWSYYQSRCQGDPSSQFSDPSLLYALEHPLTAIDYFLNLLGNSLLWPGNQLIENGLVTQRLVGLLLICLALASLLLVYKNRRLKEYSFWISLMLYSFLILAAITAGRSGQGVEQALSERYTSFSVLTVVSIYGLLATTSLKKGLSIKSSSINAILVILLSGAVLLSAVIFYPTGIEIGEHNKAKEEERAYILSTYESQSDKALANITGGNHGNKAWLIRERAPILQRLGYNVFSEPRIYSSPKKYKHEQ